MASSTTNLDLTLPVGGENVSRQIINANNVKIDEAVGPVPSGTDLQSQVTALNNKMFPSGEGTNVLTATDFNTMVEIKNYFISTSSVAAACANRPCNTAGKLCVWTINGNSFDQTWQYGGQIYYAIDGKVYQRTVGTNGSKQLSFGSWQELALKSDLNTATYDVSPYDNRVSYNQEDPVKVIKSGNVCSISGVIIYNITPTSGQTSVLVIPSGLKPQKNTYAICMRTSDSKPFVLQSATTGNINILNNGLISSGDRFYIGMTYII